MEITLSISVLAGTVQFWLNETLSPFIPLSPTVSGRGGEIVERERSPPLSFTPLSSQEYFLSFAMVLAGEGTGVR